MDIRGSAYGKRASAFTLIELSIGLTILSLLAAGALTVGGVMVEQQQFTGSNERVAEAKQALLDYFSVNGRLPCPARRTEAPGTTNFGVAVDCTVAGAAPAGTLRRSATAAFSGAAYTQGVVRIGALPVRTLGLRDSAMADEYGNRILYAMTERFASNNVAHISDALGAITLLDAKDNVIATASTDNGAVFVVFSTGPDGKGGYRYSTGSSPVSCSGGLDAENCDANITFRDTRFNNGKVAAEYFDDMLAWSPKYLLTSLVASSKAAGSTGQVQYNNGGFLSATPSFFWDITNARLGIGTSTPTQTLHIAGNASGSANQTGAQIGSAGTGTGPLFLVHNSPNVAGNAYFNAQWRYGGGTGKPATIGLSDGIRFYASNAAVGAANAAIPDFSVAAMTITPSGDVGIGTASPATKLHVNGWVRQTGGGTYLNYDNPTIYFQDTDHRSTAIHVNSNYFHILRGNGANSTTFAQYKGLWPLAINLEDNTTQLGGNTYNYGSLHICQENYTGCYLRFSDDGYFVDNNTTWTDYVNNNNGGMRLNSPLIVHGTPGWHGKTSVRIYPPGGSALYEDWPASWGGGLATWDIVGSSTYFSNYQTRSDRRYKKDIAPLDSKHMVEAVMKLKPVSYHYKDKNAAPNLQYGFIAQDVREVMPNLITGKESKTEKLGLNYDGLLAPLVATVQTLKHEQDRMKEASPSTTTSSPTDTASGHSPTIPILLGISGLQFLLWLALGWRLRQLRRQVALLHPSAAAA